MSPIKKIEPKVIPTTDSRKLGTGLLHCFLPGETLPRNASSKAQVIDIMLKATRALKKDADINDITVDDYARYFCLLNNKALVKNALLFVEATKK